MHQETFFKFLRFSLEISKEFNESITSDDWNTLYEQADKQLLLGILYNGIKRLPPSNQPPLPTVFQWASEAETINGLNKKFNAEAARLTQIFAAEGHQSAILKGQANARLYPDAFSRQPGDIDIWVNGGKKGVETLLQKLNMLYSPQMSKHHIHLATNKNDIDIEVHFRPASGSHNPLYNHRLQKILNKQIQFASQVPEGFYVPPTSFALIMQLSHIQRHFFSAGVGLRQLTDYFILLQTSSTEERLQTTSQLKRLGLLRMGKAVMWILQQVYELNHEHMICEPNSVLGNKLMDDILNGGNFGFHADWQKYKTVKRLYFKRSRALRMVSFDFWEGIFFEFSEIKRIALSIPARIRHRTLSLRGIPLKN